MFIQQQGSHLLRTFFPHCTLCQVYTTGHTTTNVCSFLFLGIKFQFFSGYSMHWSYIGILFLKTHYVGWRDGPATKSTCCCNRGPMFSSQHTHIRYLTTAYNSRYRGSNPLFCPPQAPTHIWWYTYTHSATHIHINLL